MTPGPGRGRVIRSGSVLAALLALALLATAACAAKTPDYQSIWTTSVTTTSTSPASTNQPVPFSEYLESLGVTGEPIDPAKLTDITVTLPRPKGWEKYSGANLSPGTEVVAKNNTYPTGILMVFKLHGDFDVTEAIKHANTDATLSRDFTKLNESLVDFEGFPSAMIEGSYNNQAGQRLHSYNRIVIPVTPAPAFQRYLVQLTVTSRAEQAVADADDIQGLINGFTIAVK